MILQKLLGKKSIKLFWFKRADNDFSNFGDELSKEILEKMSKRKVVWADKGSCEIVSIGSVLQAFLSKKRKNNIIVWGTGLMFDEAGNFEYDSAITDFRLVRGKLTAQKLGLNVATGDPGLIVDKLYKPSAEKKYKVGIVPHYGDKQNELLGKFSLGSDVHIIDVLQSPSHVITEITSCQLIVSSSLHGIIVAHSFGIPAYWIELSDRVAGNGFKFRDHFSVFDRVPDKFDTKKLEQIEALADKLIASYKPLKGLDEVKKSIIDTFPKNIG